MYLIYYCNYCLFWASPIDASACPVIIKIKSIIFHLVHCLSATGMCNYNYNKVIGKLEIFKISSD